MAPFAFVILGQVLRQRQRSRPLRKSCPFGWPAPECCRQLWLTAHRFSGQTPASGQNQPPGASVAHRKGRSLSGLGGGHRESAHFLALHHSNKSGGWKSSPTTLGARTWSVRWAGGFESARQETNPDGDDTQRLMRFVSSPLATADRHRRLVPPSQRQFDQLRPSSWP